MSARAFVGDGMSARAERSLEFDIPPHPVRLPHQLLAYLWGALTVLSSTELGLVGSRYLQLADIIMLQLIGVVVIATRFDRSVSIFTAALSVMAFDFVFVPPRFVFSFPDLNSIITCAGMLGVAVVISGLTTRARRFERAARLREARTAQLYELCRSLVEATNAEVPVGAAVGYFERLLGRGVALLVPHGPDRLLAVGEAHGTMWLSQGELERADELWRRGKERLGGERLLRSPGAPVTHFFFLTGASMPFGLLVTRGPASLFADASEREFFEVSTHQAGLALERAALAEKAAAAELDARREHVQNALLRSISHDFRTPLAAVTGAGLSLLEYGNELDANARSVLERTIVEQSQRLNRLLTNVLNATRIEHGVLRLVRTPCTVDEIIESALRHLGETSRGRLIEIDVPFDSPLIDVDPLLVEQLLINVVENALRYSPASLGVEIAARTEGAQLVLSVTDHGPGIRPDEEQRVFEKFYRGAAAPSAPGGLGLGLTICQAIAQAHGGSVRLANRPQRGLMVTIALPCVAERSCPTMPAIALASEGGA